MEHHEITHDDGTTTVFDRLESGDWKIYTVDGFGRDIPNSPWAEYGANYTYAELAPGYERPGDLVLPDPQIDTLAAPGADTPPIASDPQGGLTTDAAASTSGPSAPVPGNDSPTPGSTQPSSSDSQAPPVPDAPAPVWNEVPDGPEAPQTDPGAADSGSQPETAPDTSTESGAESSADSGGGGGGGNENGGGGEDGGGGGGGG